jgi:hypothetical protein
MGYEEREMVDMILHKIARMVCGDPDHPDHLDDIIGYAERVRSHRVENQVTDASRKRLPRAIPSAGE